ncbi:MAG TPA: response regulator [bacterium]|nr:response regulator [bacterium]
MSEPIRPSNIMIVDDTPQNLRLLGDLLKQSGYRVRPLPSGALALRAAEAEPPDLILLDINMPAMDGFEVCKKLKNNERLRDIPVIFISALNDTQDKVSAFNVGGQDYITKPFQFDEVLARVRTHLKIEQLQRELAHHNRELEVRVAEQVREISDSQVATIIALAKLAESRDDDTGKHIERVQIFCRLIAERMSEIGMFRDRIDRAFIENIFYAAPLHDVGKVGISDLILLKPGKLTPEEFEIMKTHSMIGWKTLQAVCEKYPRNSFLAMGRVVARHHHERWDGNGYPDKLKGDAIPLEARIMAVADVYEALRARRCYKEPFDHEKSRRILTEGGGTQFDPAVIDAFLAREKEFDRIRTEMLD